MILNNNKIIVGAIIAVLAVMVIAAFIINFGDSTTDDEEEVVDDPQIEEEETDDETTPTVVNKELIENGGFEEGESPWLNYRSAQIEVTDEEAHSGSHSLLVTDRVATVDGPQQHITEKVRRSEEHTSELQSRGHLV